MIVAYTGTAFTKKEQRELVIDAVAVLLGDYSINRKYAAILILKALLPRNLMKAVLDDPTIYPFDRSDYRVKRWTADVLSKGKCEICGVAEHLEAHHIIKWADYPGGRIDPKNGQCLCRECHTNEHKHDRSYHMMKAGRSKKT